MEPREPNPNATIQLDAIVLDDDAADAALIESTRPGPPPLPPSEAPRAASPVPSVAPAPVSSRPAWVVPVALVVGVGVAIFAGVKVGTSLHDARVAKEAPAAPPPAVTSPGSPGSPAPAPSAASAGSAPVITVPVVEMDDKPH